MYSREELVALIPGLIAPMKKFRRNAIDWEDLYNTAYLAFLEYVHETGGERERYSAAVLERMRAAVVSAVRAARSATGSGAVTQKLEARGTIGDRVRDYRKTEAGVLSSLVAFVRQLPRTTPEQKTALEILHRLHCYDQTLEEVAGVLGLDVIEVGRLAEQGVVLIRTALGDRKWRVLRGRLTGVLDKWEPPEGGARWAAK